MHHTCEDADIPDLALEPHIGSELVEVNMDGDGDSN